MRNRLLTAIAAVLVTSPLRAAPPDAGASPLLLPQLSSDGSRVALPVHERTEFHGGKNPSWHEEDRVVVTDIGRTDGGRVFVVNESDARFGLFGGRHEGNALDELLRHGGFHSLAIREVGKRPAGFDVGVMRDDAGATVTLRRGGAEVGHARITKPEGATRFFVEARHYVVSGGPRGIVYVEVVESWGSGHGRVYHDGERTEWVALPTH